MTINGIIAALITAILIENVILSQFLGICAFLGVSTNKKSAAGMGLAVVIVILLATIVTWVLYNYVLSALDLTYLKTIVFILVIASLVQMIEVIIKKFVPSLYKSLGIYLPLITTNCAVLGVALKSVNNSLSFGSMFLYALGSGVGFLLVIYLFSYIREELAKRNVPKAMQGIPIALIVASILAILFSRYVGISPKDTKSSINESSISINEKAPSEEYYDEHIGGIL